HQTLFIFCVLLSAKFSVSIDSQNPNEYDHIIVRGLPFERGVSHGIQAKDKILRGIALYKTSTKVLPWEESLAFVRENYIGAIAKYYPTALDEMKGIAHGAGVSLDEIVFLNARYDLSRVQRAHVEQAKQENLRKEPSVLTTTSTFVDDDDIANECTGGIALKSSTANGHVLIAQNWDYLDFIRKNDTGILLEIHPDPSENIKPLMMVTEAGQLGRSGMSTSGLGVLSMSLWSTGDVVDSRNKTEYPYGWVPITLLRRMFLEAPTFPMGIKRILSVPRHVSNNMVLATAEDEAIDLELTPKNFFLINVPVDKEILSHSNHFKAPGFLARDDIGDNTNGDSTLFRDRRVLKKLYDSWPSITESTFKEAFSDDVGHPNGVCKQTVPDDLRWTTTTPNSSTIGSVIYNLSTKTIQFCKGPPCLGTFKKYTFSD
ncbi:hypothetical protein Bhyg_01121, partial [Pseudolycoriella hygida]